MLASLCVFFAMLVLALLAVVAPLYALYGLVAAVLIIWPATVPISHACRKAPRTSQYQENKQVTKLCLAGSMLPPSAYSSPCWCWR